MQQPERDAVPRPIRVLAVTNMYPTAADPVFGRFVARQMVSVANAGADVEILFIAARGRDWRYVWGMLQTFRRAISGRFDLVHAHFGLTGFVTAFQPLPLVVSFCGDDLFGTPDGRGGATRLSRLATRLSHWAARRADAIICKSEPLRAALPRAVDRDRAYVIGNGVDTDMFRPGDRLAARARLRLGPDDRLVLFPHTRKQASVKRFDLAEAAVRLLVAGGCPAVLWVVNDVDPDRMPDYYRAADCLLLTSEHEGSPNTVKEALCCDRPVVSVDVGDVRRLIDVAPGCRLGAPDSLTIAAGL